ncbi:hypothetical protein WJX75_009547 [Coccomyxa subellipsoidea]|uniref:Proteasome subunit beta n=1 Tax=Coccomyxa subellipsoidea TaxID=248742 RepID=A0ABR2YH02_9CHLO
MYPRPTSHNPALGPGCTGPSLAQYVPDCVDVSSRPTVQQPSSGAAPFMVDPKSVAAGLGGHDPTKHTTTPYVTGTSVLGVTYRDGVLLAADTLGSYGSTKRYKSFERLRKVNEQTIIGAGGELSDFQYILTLLDELSNEDFCADDDAKLSPKEIYAYLSRVLYNRRSKMDPLWNSLVVGGLQDGKPFLGTITMLGVHYSDDHIATGFGQMLARPLFRERHRPDMSEEEATQLLHEGLRVCYYRDKQTTNKFQIAKVTAEGTTISDPFALETKWDYKAFVNPGALAVGTW